jgi:hypothetical protein
VAPIVATVVFDELQFTPLTTVTLSVLPSLKVAVAVICLLVPIAIWAGSGVILKLEMLAATTLIPVLPPIEPDVATIVAGPKPTAETKPVLVTVATLVAEELVTMPLMFCVVLSSKVPVAVN